MFSERAISHAHAQCRSDPLEIGNALYGLYNDQSRIELMRMVFGRLNQNQRQWAIDQLEKKQSKLQREGNGDWHNVAQCIRLCKHIQTQLSNYRLRAICDKWLSWKMWKRGFLIAICLVALVTVISSWTGGSELRQHQVFHEKVRAICHQITTNPTNVTPPPFCLKAYDNSTFLAFYSLTIWLAHIVVVMGIIRGGVFVYSHWCCGRQEETTEVIADGRLAFDRQ